MKLFIPPLGTRLVLTAPWTCKLIQESRNNKLIDELRKYFPGVPGEIKFDHYTYSRTAPLCDFQFGVGTSLTVDRIYIRKGGSDFDSVSFFVSIPNGNLKPIKGRFWVKLADANKIEADVL
jgi:hypothetical protein